MKDCTRRAQICTKADCSPVALCTYLHIDRLYLHIYNCIYICTDFGVKIWRDLFFLSGVVYHRWLSFLSPGKRRNRRNRRDRWKTSCGGTKTAAPGAVIKRKRTPPVVRVRGRGSRRLPSSSEPCSPADSQPRALADSC